MIFSKRDFNMVLLIIAVLLGGLTYLLADPMVRQWKEAKDAQALVDRDKSIARRLLDQREDLQSNVAELRSTLPTYELDETVGAELLREVRRLADENRVVTTRITPGAEENIGDLYEQALEVTWEAELGELVRFLYAVQVAGATLDIRQMTIAPSRETKLKGNLKIFFAYTRYDAEAQENADGITVEEMN